MKIKKKFEIFNKDCNYAKPNLTPTSLLKNIFFIEFIFTNKEENECLGPYHVESTGSRPITEVKQRRARLVLGWVTAWEYWVF